MRMPAESVFYRTALRDCMLKTPLPFPSRCRWQAAWLLSILLVCASQTPPALAGTPASLVSPPSLTPPTGLSPPPAPGSTANKGSTAGKRSTASPGSTAGLGSTATPSPLDTERTLANGLRIVVHEDHRAPTAVVQVWYRVGSVDESDGHSGLAHVLEHMMFKGTPKVPVGRFSKIIARAGGKDNAFTGQDHTAYFEQIHRDQLALALTMEADRMVNLSFRDSDFASEIKVVMEERHLRTDDQPKALVEEQLMATALVSNPYRRPIIGWLDDLQHMTADDARSWYRTWYAPNNAILVVAGDVQPEQVFRLAQKTFGPLKPHPLPQRRPQQEPEQLGARRIAVRATAGQPYLAIAWPGPALRDVEHDWEPFALELLAGVLAGGDTGRFGEHLVHGDQVAVTADAGFEDIRRGPGIFSVEGTPAPGVTAEALERSLLAQIHDIQQHGVSEGELKRVKAQVISEQIYGHDSTFFQAMQIGTFDALGLPWREADRVPVRLQQITAEQVRQVAQRYLIPEHANLAVLEPLPVGKASAPTPAGETGAAAPAAVPAEDHHAH